MCLITGSYELSLNDRFVGTYIIFNDRSESYYVYNYLPDDVKKQLRKLGLDKDIISEGTIDAVFKYIKEENRVPGRKRIIYKEGPISLERKPEHAIDSFTIYDRSARKGEPGYSELKFDAPHYEGSLTPEGMREWASWYKFNKMDDGTYEAELDEAWWWGGGHNDGGTIHNEIPEEWFELPYDEFLSKVIILSSASHYGFTVEMLKEKEGLKKFFGYK